MEFVRVSVLLMTLCINGYLAVTLSPMFTPVRKGQDVTFTCDAESTFTSFTWRTYYYNVTTSLATGSAVKVNNTNCNTERTCTVKDISESDIFKAFECGFGSFAKTWVLLPASK